MHDLLETNFLL